MRVFTQQRRFALHADVIPAIRAEVEYQYWELGVVYRRAQHPAGPSSDHQMVIGRWVSNRPARGNPIKPADAILIPHNRGRNQESVKKE